MAYPQTPQRPLPGAFLMTPAVSRVDPRGSQAVQALPQLQSNLSRPQNTQLQQRPIPLATAPQPLPPIQRAARTINQVLQQDANYPDLDSYVKQGISSEYDVPNPTADAAWAPYQRSRMYDIPDQIFAQYNNAQVATMMGLFAELNHAWVTIDNALYLWDYTQNNPELIGYEEQSQNITAVSLTIPRPGVFVPTITHILVVATTSEILMIGVAAKEGPTGNKTVALYQTRMSLSIRGIDVRVIEGSRGSGRIFFAGGGDNDLYELTYQQEEKWFANRCAKINHTSPGYTSLVPAAIWGRGRPEFVMDIVIDDTRNLVYTLSSESSIRTFHMDSATSLTKVIEKKRQECLRDIGHMMTPQSPLLSDTTRIVSISAISATEASKLHLMALTSTGCRLFLSATRGYGMLAGKGDAPQSMQVQHVKFPPRDQQEQPSQTSGQLVNYQAGEQPVNTTSYALAYSRRGLRYPPGIFLDFVRREASPNTDVLFLSAPDAGRMVNQFAAGQGWKFYEQALWTGLESRAEAVGLVTKPFGAAPTPLGFGNELAVQYDQPSTEIAILTNTGIHVFRRRRLVDMFAASIRRGGGDEGLESEMKRFRQKYGKGEATSAALAVACGQGADVAAGDARIVQITDPAILESARKAFIEFGGKPFLDEVAALESTKQAIDHVRPSARHDGLALYIARLIRSLWKTAVIGEVAKPTGGQSIISKVSMSKLRSVQDDLFKLDDFLDSNSTFIEGLTGPDTIHVIGSRQEEIALQGEHQALHSLQKLTKNICEGISFVMMLFDERVDELWASLDDVTQRRFKALTYEALFSTDDGKDLGKVLVKAIVNRNIANGSNVDTVADALRRRCKSFCSANDVMIFKAQEQLKRAGESGANTDLENSLLNESLRLFEGVAGSLSPENLETAVREYLKLNFYGGAIRLALRVASEIDRGNRALSWINDGKPENDARSVYFQKRKACYDLIHNILVNVDAVSRTDPEFIDGRPSGTARKRNQAYEVVNESEDEVFHFDLYDWYLSQGWTDRLLAVQSPYVITYLQRLSDTTIEHADLIWRFYANAERYYDAAAVQLQLARSSFPLTLKRRIEYLGRAKANASTNTAGTGRQARQVLLHEVSELLEVAIIQDDILQRLKGDDRITPERRLQIIGELDGQVINLSELYNNYADQASYFDVCLLIYQAADHRNPADITTTWTHVLQQAHSTALDKGDDGAQPYEAVITIVRELAHRLNMSDVMFNPVTIIPLLESYAFQYQRNVGPPTWVADLLIDVGIPYETIVPILEGMLYNNEAPFTGRNRAVIARDTLYIITKWYQHCVRSNQRIFGSEDTAAAISQLLLTLTQNGLNQNEIGEAQTLRAKIERNLR